MKVCMPFFDLFQHDADLLEINAGETLFRQGESGAVMYVLVEGEAEIFIDGVSFEKCGPGSVVGEISIIDHEPRRATVVACVQSRFAAVNRKRFHFMLDETPGFAMAIMHVLTQRLARCDQRVIQLTRAALK